MLIPEIWLFKGVKAEYEVIPVYLLFRYRSIYLYIFVSKLINFLWKKIFKHLNLFIYRIFKDVLAIFMTTRETGRYTKPVTPVDLRVCEFCNLNVTEDEKHFLLSCPFYDDIRYEFFNEVTMYNQSFYDLSTDEKFTYILGNDNIQKVLARTVNKMFNRRKYIINYFFLESYYA